MSPSFGLIVTASSFARAYMHAYTRIRACVCVRREHARAREDLLFCRSRAWEERASGALDIIMPQFMTVYIIRSIMSPLNLFNGAKKICLQIFFDDTLKRHLTPRNFWPFRGDKCRSADSEFVFFYSRIMTICRFNAQKCPQFARLNGVTWLTSRHLRINLRAIDA